MKLNARQEKILELVRQGKTDREIAPLAKLSLKQTSREVSVIVHGLGATRRRELWAPEVHRRQCRRCKAHVPMERFVVEHANCVDCRAILDARREGVRLPDPNRDLRIPEVREEVLSVFDFPEGVEWPQAAHLWSIGCAPRAEVVLRELSEASA